MLQSKYYILLLFFLPGGYLKWFVDYWTMFIIYHLQHIEFQSQIKNRKCISINVPAYIENIESDYAIMEFPITIKHNRTNNSRLKWILFMFPPTCHWNIVWHDEITVVMIKLLILILMAFPNIISLRTTSTKKKSQFFTCFKGKYITRTHQMILILPF